MRQASLKRQLNNAMRLKKTRFYLKKQHEKTKKYF